MKKRLEASHAAIRDVMFDYKRGWCRFERLRNFAGFSPPPIQVAASYVMMGDLNALHITNCNRLRWGSP